MTTITLQLMKDYENNKERLTNEDIYVWTSDSASRVVEIFSNINPMLVVAGYLLMLVYCAFAFSRLHPVKSRANVGLVRSLLSSCVNHVFPVGWFAVGSTSK